MPPIGLGTPTEFKTYFVSPNKIRFEWRSWHPHQSKSVTPNLNVIVSDGIKSQSLFLGELRELSLSLAIGGATGVSSGAVHMILKLLMPDCVKLNKVWFEFVTASIEGEEEISGALCHHITLCSTDETLDC